MPRLPLPRLRRAAATMLVASGLLAAGAQTASAASASLTASIPVANSPSGSPVLWSGDLSTNPLSAFPFLWACPGGVSLSSAQPFNGQPSIQFTVNDNSTSSGCPGHVFTSNPASSLLTPNLFGNGDDRYIAFSTLFPTGFPSITNWFQFAEIFGPPYGGSPTIGLDVKGNQLGLWRDGTHHFDNPWRAPIQYGTWENLVLHVKFSTNPAVGFVEIWLNGVAQHFTNGSTRLYYTTLLPGDNWNGVTKNDLDLDQYRAASPSLGPLTIYHAAAKVGTSLAAVTPPNTAPAGS